jgi:hypothetical protein
MSLFEELMTEKANKLSYILPSGYSDIELIVFLTQYDIRSLGHREGSIEDFLYDKVKERCIVDLLSGFTSDRHRYKALYVREEFTDGAWNEVFVMEGTFDRPEEISDCIEVDEEDHFGWRIDENRDKKIEFYATVLSTVPCGKLAERFRSNEEFEAYQRGLQKQDKIEDEEEKDSKDEDEESEYDDHSTYTYELIAVIDREEDKIYMSDGIHVASCQAGLYGELDNVGRFSAHRSAQEIIELICEDVLGLDKVKELPSE